MEYVEVYEKEQAKEDEEFTLICIPAPDAEAKTLR